MSVESSLIELRVDALSLKNGSVISAKYQGLDSKVFIMDKGAGYADRWGGYIIELSGHKLDGAKQKRLDSLMDIFDGNDWQVVHY